MIKKAQEEIVGFVIIVVLVMIVALIFLSFSLTKTSRIEESAAIGQFLESASEYTTNCSISFSNNYAKIRDLYDECRNKRQCVNEKDSCDVLNDTLSEIINAGLRVGAERPIKGYLFKAVFVENVSESENELKIIDLKQGNCTGTRRRGVSDFSPADEGIIRSQLDVCY